MCNVDKLQNETLHTAFPDFGDLKILTLMTQTFVFNLNSSALCWLLGPVKDVRNQ